jgi:hypothetical protein
MLAAPENDVDRKRYVAWLDTVAPAAPARCYVEHVSRSGARLRVVGSPIDAVPDEFTLRFGEKGDAKVRCRVTSRAGGNCAVEFVASLAMYA